jgi:hypothetical protein
MSYNVSVATQDVPPSILPFGAPRPPAANIRQVVVQNNTGSASAAGRLEFQLPGASLAYLKSGSAYIRMTVSASGPGVNAWTFSGPAGSCSSLINRLNLSIGGVSVERIDSYHLATQAMLLHTGGNYLERDAPVLECPAATNAAKQVAMPVNCQLLNSGYHLPLWAMSQGSCVLSLDLNTAVEALLENTSASITGFTITDCQLVYDVIEMSPEFIANMKQQMAGGKAYSIPFLSFRSVSKSDEANAIVNMALNVSSLKGVFWFARAAKTLITAGLFAGGTQTACRLYCDGQLINSVIQSDIPTQYAELQKFLSKLNDNTVTAGVAITQANYDTDYFTGAVNTRCYDDAGYGFQGRPASTLALEVAHTAQAVGGQLHAFAAYDSILVIDPSGVPVVLQ